MDIQEEKSHEELAKDARLTYTTDASPGIRRISHGKGFIYADTQGIRVKDPLILDRIKRLGIPPAWSSVWICKKPKGHLQATGYDEKGRKQYRYHAEWIEASQHHKFNRMIFFSDVLPTIRQQIKMDMQTSGLQRKKVLATIVWLLEHTYIRVGNEEYAKENKHYGLTTLRNKHVSIEGNTVTFDFVGKSGKVHSVDIASPQVARTIRKLEELPGYELFQYVEAGSRHSVTSQDVNEYLREITGSAISAKDFRTWGGTVLSAITLNNLGVFETKRQASKNITKAVNEVAHQLRNTPTISRKYYIHPIVPDTYQRKILIPYFTDFFKENKENLIDLSRDEVAVQNLLKEFSLSTKKR